MAKLIIFSTRSDAEESDAPWRAESQKQQKRGRGLRREGAVILCYPGSRRRLLATLFFMTQFFLVVVHIILKKISPSMYKSLQI